MGALPLRDMSERTDARGPALPAAFAAARPSAATTMTAMPSGRAGDATPGGYADRPPRTERLALGMPAERLRSSKGNHRSVAVARAPSRERQEVIRALWPQTLSVFGHPRRDLKRWAFLRGCGGAISPEKGAARDNVSLHSQFDSVTISHSDPDELKRILEIARVMGATAGPANAGGQG